MKEEVKDVIVRHSFGATAIVVVCAVILAVALWNNIPLLFAAISIAGHFDLRSYIYKKI